MAQKSWFLKGDVVSGAVLAALGVYIISEARQWNYVGPEGPGPGFFPLWYGIAMVILSLWLVVVSAVRPAAAGAPARAAGATGGTVMNAPVKEGVKTTPMSMIQALRSAMDVMLERDEDELPSDEPLGEPPGESSSAEEPMLKEVDGSAEISEEMPVDADWSEVYDDFSPSTKSNSDDDELQDHLRAQLSGMRLAQADMEQFALIQMNIGREVCRRLRATDELLFASQHGSAELGRDTVFRHH